MAVAGLVLGIIAAVTAWFFPVVPIIVGVVGIVLSVLAMKQAKTGVATAGLVLSIIGVALAVIGTICLLVCAAGAAAGAGLFGF